MAILKQIYETRTGQKLVCIPRNSKLKGGDWVVMYKVDESTIKSSINKKEGVLK